MIHIYHLCNNWLSWFGLLIIEDVFLYSYLCWFGLIVRVVLRRTSSEPQQGCSHVCWGGQWEGVEPKSCSSSKGSFMIYCGFILPETFNIQQTLMSFRFMLTFLWSEIFFWDSTLQVINDRFSIVEGLMTTIHSRHWWAEFKFLHFTGVFTILISLLLLFWVQLHRKLSMVHQPRTWEGEELLLLTSFNCEFV